MNQFLQKVTTVALNITTVAQKWPLCLKRWPLWLKRRPLCPKRCPMGPKRLPLWPKSEFCASKDDHCAPKVTTVALNITIMAQNYSECSTSCISCICCLCSLENDFIFNQIQGTFAANSKAQWLYNYTPTEILQGKPFPSTGIWTHHSCLPAKLLTWICTPPINHVSPSRGPRRGH